jgi:hypothetical protein
MVAQQYINICCRNPEGMVSGSPMQKPTASPNSVYFVRRRSGSELVKSGIALISLRRCSFRGSDSGCRQKRLRCQWRVPVTAPTQIVIPRNQQYQHAVWAIGSSTSLDSVWAARLGCWLCPRQSLAEEMWRR